MRSWPAKGPCGQEAYGKLERGRTSGALKQNGSTRVSSSLMPASNCERPSASGRSNSAHRQAGRTRAAAACRERGWRDGERSAAAHSCITGRTPLIPTIPLSADAAALRARTHLASPNAAKRLSVALVDDPGAAIEDAMMNL
jgi:hypothetical protein